MGLTLNVNTFPAYYYKFISSDRINSINVFHYSQFIRSTFLEVLLEMFGMNFWYYDYEIKEYFVSEWLSNGWVFAQKDDWICLEKLASHELHGLANLFEGDSVPRTLRQLLALGLFREPASEQFWSKQCDGCRHVNPEFIIHRKCPLLMPFVDEFFRGPLSLLQLSRAEIRRLVGTNDFSNRMKTLQNNGLLPPRLVEYVWRADELLAADVPFQ